MKSSWVPLRLDVSAEPQQRIIDTVLIDTTMIGTADPSRLAYGLIADALVQPMVRNGRLHFTGRVDSSHLTSLWKQGTRQLEEQFQAIREMMKQSEEEQQEEEQQQRQRQEPREKNKEDDPPCQAGPAESTRKRGKDATPNDMTHASPQHQEQKEPDSKKQKTWHDSTTTIHSSSTPGGGPQPQNGATTMARRRPPTPASPNEEQRRSKQQPELIIPIHLRLCFHGIYVHDDFDWDVSLSRHLSPLDVATRLAHDLNLALDAIPIVATAIIEQIHGIPMLHQLDEDESERTTAAWPVPAHSNINHAAIVSRNHPPTTTTAAAKASLSSS